MSARPISATSDNLPRRLGRFEMVERLATRPGTLVLKGHLHDDPTGPTLVAKCVTADVLEGRSREDFLAEVRRASAVRHTNLVTVRDCGEQEGELYVVMDHLVGVSADVLVDLLRARGQTMDLGLAAHVVAEASAGLEAAHGAGLLHEHLCLRDVFLGADGLIRVLGLGVARAIHNLTRTKTIAADELPYAAPERCKGDELDRRADVFSLGAILWELMSGISPFARETEVQTIRAIISEDPTPPPTEVLRGLPSQLAEVATRALSRSRTGRYPTAVMLRQELLRFTKSHLAGPFAAQMLGELVEVVAGVAAAARNADQATSAGVAVSEDARPTYRPRPDPSPPPVAMPDDEEIVLPGLERRGAGRRVVAAVVGVVLALLVVSGFLYSRTTRAPGTPPLAEGSEPLALSSTPAAPTRPAPTPTTPTPTAATSTVAASIAAPPRATAAGVKLQIETLPPKVAVFIDGQQRGTTPFDLVLDRSDTPLEIELRRPGYQTIRERIVPNVDQKLRLTLLVAAGARPSATGSAPYFRFE